MAWYIFFFISLTAFLTTLTLFFIARFVQRKKLKSALQIMFCGMFITVFTALLPIYYRETAATDNQFWHVLKTLILDIQKSVKSFAIADVGFITKNPGLDEGLYSLYSGYLAVLFFTCPLLSLSYILAFFTKLRSNVEFLLNYNKDLYIFSALTKDSLALATDIASNHPHVKIVFCEVTAALRDENSALIQGAEQISAICFHRDVKSVNFNRHGKGRLLCFFNIKPNEQSNTADALLMLSRYKNRENTELYIFSTLTESRLVLANADSGKIKMRRVDKVQTFINRFLYDRGEELFHNAAPLADGSKEIFAVIVGLGKCGSEMLKALTWYCQMDGYHIHIDVFEKSHDAEDRLKSDCPELLSDRFNGARIKGEAEYTINFHSGIDYHSKRFFDAISLFPHPTFVFVAIGSDAANIDASIALRRHFERMGMQPDIYAVLLSNEKKKTVDGIRNFRGQEYHIQSIGDTASVFSEKEIIHSEIEAEALRIHLKWGVEEDFWKYEYNHRSSLSTAIHRKAKIACGLLDPNNPPDTEEEIEALSLLEHKRWNAYIRSEGYIYSGSTDKATKNDLGKMHNDLTDFYSLNMEEKNKDHVISL